MTDSFLRVHQYVQGSCHGFYSDWNAKTIVSLVKCYLCKGDPQHIWIIYANYSYMLRVYCSVYVQGWHTLHILRVLRHTPDSSSCLLHYISTGLCCLFLQFLTGSSVILTKETCSSGGDGRLTLSNTQNSENKIYKFAYINKYINNSSAFEWTLLPLNCFLQNNKWIKLQIDVTLKRVRVRSHNKRHFHRRDLSMKPPISTLPKIGKYR